MGRGTSDIPATDVHGDDGPQNQCGRKRPLLVSLLSDTRATDLEVRSIANRLDRLCDLAGHDLRLLFCWTADSRSLSSLLAMQDAAGVTEIQQAVVHQSP